jgi:hypothetical protein
MLLTLYPFLIDKSSQADFEAHSHKFDHMDISMDELAGIIGEGVAFSAQFKGKGRRLAANFKEAGFLAVDIDAGLTINEVQRIPLYQNHCALLYTTHSHTEENHRFRLVFELESPIIERDRMEAAYSGLIVILGGDKACSDASRLFFGSSKGLQILRNGMKLPTSVVDELVELGKDFKSRKKAESVFKTKDFESATSASGIWIPKNQKIRTANEAWEYLEDLPLKTHVYCPIHNDAKPSAFVLKSTKGVKGVHCGSKCKATYFLDRGDGHAAKARPYDFDYDWVSAMNSDSEAIEAHLEALEEYFGDKSGRIFTNKANGQYLPESTSSTRWDSPEHSRVLPSIIGIHTQYIRAKDVACRYTKFTNDYFVGRDNSLAKAKAFREETVYADDAKTPFEEKAVHNWLLNEGMTFIKSPKGTGKTQMLEEVVKEYPKLINNVRILLIGHRRSLINATAKRLDLTSYLNTDETSSVEFIKPTNLYAISLDSMGKMMANTKPYDVVIIDEVEQVFSHLLSDTLGKERKKAILYLQHFINKAKHVFLLDADMTPLSIEIMSAMNKAGSNKDAFAVINTFKATGRELNLYNHKEPDHLVADLMAALKSGKRCFLCSNSKSRIDGLTRELGKILPEKKIMTITSDNSDGQEAQEFILNIKEEALKYDLVAVSPSMSTGVDITFPDNSELIDCVFGIFQDGINTHFDIDQQLSRVRHPGQVNVWVSGVPYNFETDANIIRHEISALHDQFRSIKEIDENGAPVYFEACSADLLHEAIYGAVMEVKRASMNRLRDNFVALREHNGWMVKLIGRDADKAALGDHLISEGKKALKAQQNAMILNAPQIDSTQLEGLRKKKSLTQQEQAAVDRYFIEAFFHADVTEEILGPDKGESLMKAVELYDALQMSIAEQAPTGAYVGQELRYDREKLRLKSAVLSSMLMATGLFDGKQFIRGKEVSKADLSGFVEKCKNQKVILEVLCNISVTDHIDTDPISKLKAILKLFGMTTVPGNDKSFSGGGRTYYHRLEETSLDRLERWHAQYSNKDAKALWSRERGIESMLTLHAKKTIQKIRTKTQDGDDDVDLS